MERTEARAVARTVRIAPRKTRLIINLIRGKNVADAFAILRNQPQRAARVIEKVLHSAVSNAVNNLKTKLTFDKNTFKVDNESYNDSYQLTSVDDLREGLYFDIFNSRKNLLTYRDGDNPQVTMPDGYKVKQKCSCNIRPTSYKLTLTGDYRELIKKYLTQKYH